MKRLFVLFMAVALSSCIHPYYTKASIRKFRHDKTPASLNDVHISSYHFSAGQRKGSLRVITDTLTLDRNMEAMIRISAEEHGFRNIELVDDSTLAMLIDPKLRWRNRKLLRFLKEQDFDDNTLIPIICYIVSFEPERAGGGGLEFVYKTGNDRYMIGHEVYLAFYNNRGLSYLRNVSRWDEKIVPAGTPITHEFPQEVLDTLMHMALEPLLKQMEKER